MGVAEMKNSQNCEQIMVHSSMGTLPYFVDCG